MWITFTVPWCVIPACAETSTPKNLQQGIFNKKISLVPWLIFSANLDSVPGYRQLPGGRAAPVVCFSGLPESKKEAVDKLVFFLTLACSLINLCP